MTDWLVITIDLLPIVNQLMHQDLDILIINDNFASIICCPFSEQGKSEGFDSWDRPSNLIQIGFKSSIFQPVWPWNWMDDPKKQ